MNVNLITYWEHKDDYFSSESLFEKENYQVMFKKTRRNKDVSLPCYTISHQKEKLYKITAGYFVGVDWINDSNVLYIEPKLNKGEQEIDYIKMLFSALRHPDVSPEINELFEIKWDADAIEIEQKQDLLTPFLVVEFLSLLKTIVRKGLKKSYYKVEQNLRSKVKGKILVGQTIKQNLVQNKRLDTYCAYDEFGLNNKENRLLKKALIFIQRYLPNYVQLNANTDLQNTFNYINPAFLTVSDAIELNEIKHSKTNAFYKEYQPAIRLAKLILKRFGYNISNTTTNKISTPPFWIDMSKLFELYTLGLLKDRFQKEVLFQYSPDRGNELDFIVKEKDYEMVIDTKYKTHWKDNPVHEDVRQVSGYARLKSVYNHLGFLDLNKVIDTLIIYPDLDKNASTNFKGNSIIENRIEEKLYHKVYKLGIQLPVIK